MLVVGNTKEFDKPLSSLGTVKEIDITIPPPPPISRAQGMMQAKPAASNPEGKALAAKVAAAMGGLPKLHSIKTMHVSIAESDGGVRRIRSKSPSRSPTACTSTFKRARHPDHRRDSDGRS